MPKPVYFLLFFVCLGLLGSCKKYVEDQKQQLLLQAMTDGTWHIETFQQGTVTLTQEFDGYDFQFRDNGTVSGTKGTEVTNGTWLSDIQNYSIVSDFPDAPQPLSKLNGTWRITDTGKDYVVAEMTTDQGKDILRLRKNM